MADKKSKIKDQERNDIIARSVLERMKDIDLVSNSMDQHSLPLVETGRDVDHLEAVEVALDDDSEKRGRGRPKGSKNKRTEDWTEYLLNNYRSPLIMFAETYSRPTAGLALELHCSLEDAFKIQMDAAKQLAPYVHQKLPQAIEIDTDKGLVSLTLVVTDAYAAVQSKAGLEIIDAESIEIEEPEKSSEINEL